MSKIKPRHEIINLKLDTLDKIKAYQKKHRLSSQAKVLERWAEIVERTEGDSHTAQVSYENGRISQIVLKPNNKDQFRKKVLCDMDKMDEDFEDMKERNKKKRERNGCRCVYD